MKICLNCSLPNLSATRRGGRGGVLCDRCYKQEQSERNKSRGKLYGTEWQKISKAARAAQPWCSKCKATEDLTFDHETSSVECRACNAKHRGTTIK